MNDAYPKSIFLFFSNFTFYFFKRFTKNLKEYTSLPLPGIPHQPAMKLNIACFFVWCLLGALPQESSAFISSIPSHHALEATGASSKPHHILHSSSTETNSNEPEFSLQGKIMIFCRQLLTTRTPTDETFSKKLQFFLPAPLRLE
jgi:hypothetical protein